jgi:ABC-2 type transport system permease protein
MNFNRTLIGFLIKEARQALRDTRMRVLLFVAPIIQLTLFGVALSNEVRNIRLAAVYASSDSVARHIVERGFASGWFVPTEVRGPDVFEWLRSGEADVVMVAPPGGLTKAIERGDAAVQVLINSQNVLRAQAVENYVKAIVNQTVAADMRGQKAQMITPAVSIDVRPLYNPTFETAVYMVPGVMSILICLITIQLTSMSIAREKEIGTFETLIAAPVRSWEVILGKALPYVLVGMLQVPLILLAAVALFGIPMRGPLIMLFTAAFFFVVTTVSIGILISTVTKSQQQAMLGGFLFLFPAVLLSGLMFPLENMPFLMRVFAEINPLSHFIALLRNILLKGGSLEFFAKHTAFLAVLAVICLVAAFKRFQTRL